METYATEQNPKETISTIHKVNDGASPIKDNYHGKLNLKIADSYEEDKQKLNTQQREEQKDRILFKSEEELEVENYNTKLKLDLDKICNTNNTLTSENIETNKYKQQCSDITLSNQVDGISQIMRRDSKLNLSISRISLKNNFPQDNTSSKLRSIYKKVNQSILNITDVKSSENQFIKFFTNNSLYENPKNKESIALNKNSAEVLKDKKPAQTAKKLASDVISIYRNNISNQIKCTSEKNEAKEIVGKQTGAYRKFTHQILKKKYIPEVDVETIMRSPVQKYAKSNFPCNSNQTYVSMVSRANVTAINPNSRVLSPIRNFTDRFKDILDKDKKKVEDLSISNTLRRSRQNFEIFKRINTNEDLDDAEVIREETKNEDEIDTFDSLFRNKYKDLVAQTLV